LEEIEKSYLRQDKLPAKPGTADFTMVKESYSKK
jgi:hypothetical protein